MFLDLLNIPNEDYELLILNLNYKLMFSIFNYEKLATWIGAYSPKPCLTCGPSPPLIEIKVSMDLYIIHLFLMKFLDQYLIKDLVSWSSLGGNY